MNHDLISTIRQAVIGDKHPITTSFGRKPLVYADYTASGRALSFIEDYIRQQVMPYYANTHTETSYTGAQSTRLREQAREIIRAAVNGNDDDKVIFCGPGATAAINKLIDILNIRLPADLSQRYQLMDNIAADDRPVVFIGPYEHHSNELPWRESIADVVAIPLDNNGQIDTATLQQKLVEYADRKVKIGSFSAASNVTGIKSDVDAIATLLHRHQAISLWDYAAAAPYVGIDMNPDKHSYKDAVFISPHKFIGGPGTPGVLVVKKQLLNNSVPALPGGGTVTYVTPEDHRYSDNFERREEGGTPAIIESIRAGLAFKLQQDVGTDTIEALETDFIQRAFKQWQQHDNIDILGGTTAERLSIVSLQIKHRDEDLHYGFVVALLNDLFGIQARGGCSCAGPYGHSLLNMPMSVSKALEAELVNGHMVLRPGWVRLNFNYFIDEATFQYLVQAVELIAQHGWRLLPYYNFDQASGTWLYQNKTMTMASCLQQLDFSQRHTDDELSNETFCLQQCLDTAKQLLTTPQPGAQQYRLELPASAEALRWFALPQQVAAAFNSNELAS
ncbi:Cysteine desulfurase [Sinobacterium norvegicum]|uniref:Cysteine desulfurase n=1 Tax=Sinobacterium norvegicum TaxID=1641715 RepID=A0ABM9AGS4_9GAMM|nr:aminotransferase class V-fold PLP-dependent enzyme [Sinobacterium norvegicum]CAH0992409.1 Cysteine desulfurase [Sinobacterium norvegicum]